MKFQIKMIEAKTHSPEYLLHKYWARKPHNVISQCFDTLVPKNGKVLDPFSGSGVTLREAGLLNLSSIGIDLNPVATLITNVLISPPNTNEFIKVMNKIIETVKNETEHLYYTLDNNLVKYTSHKIIVKCSCGNVINLDESIIDKRTHRCPYCNSILRYNLENLYDTEIFDVISINSNSYSKDKNEIKNQKELSMFGINKSDYDYKFVENRRILSFDGLTTSSFFTKRNYLTISKFFDEAHKIKEEKMRNAVLSLLTASVAQCSRLIAHRNNLTTGGPAWSIPGFWVPKEHLETNPFIHIEARLKKFVRGLKTLEKNPVIIKPRIITGDSLEILESNYFDNEKFDLIFLDPPYGDSVPYTEFSAIWNSFLKIQPAIEKDISVSDRMEKKKSWSLYSDSLRRYMTSFKNILTNDGVLLITFNNKDIRAWESLISSLQENNFICKSVIYQIPAVISSKAQKNITTSYISDIYSVYMHNSKRTPSKDLSLIISDLSRIGSMRGGIVPEMTLEREYILSFLKNNISVDLLTEKDKILNSMFNYSKQNKTFNLKKEYFINTVNLKNFIREAVDEVLIEGPLTLKDCYIQVALKAQNLGTIEFLEFLDFISDYVIEGDKIFGKPKNN